MTGYGIAWAVVSGVIIAILLVIMFDVRNIATDIHEMKEIMRKRNV